MGGARGLTVYMGLREKMGMDIFPNPIWFEKLDDSVRAFPLILADT